MSSASSAVTYTSVYTNSEPERPVAPLSSDYLPDSKEPQTPPVPQDEDEGEPMFIQPHDPDYVPEPMYPEYIPMEDEHKFLAEEQPLPPIVSPTAESPGYTPPPPLTLLPLELGLLFGFRLPYPFHQRHRCTAPPALSSPPPVPSLLQPSSGCPTQIQTLRMASTQALVDAVTAALPSPPLPPLPPSLYIPPPVDRKNDIPESEQPPHKRLCLSTLGSKYEIRESSTARPTRGQGIDYGFFRIVDAEARRQGISEVRYGIRDTWVDLAEAVPEIAPMTVGEVNTRVIEVVELHERDTQDLYALLEDAEDGRTGDSIDYGGGGLCFLRGLGSLDRIESGDPSGASDPP
ncbi:hypothetical protein Tco_1288205 [Tanacetum coccineum]